MISEVQPNPGGETLPRTSDGRFAPRSCPNPMCSGQFVREGSEWICDGLVDPGNGGELEACLEYLR